MSIDALSPKDWDLHANVGAMKRSRLPAVLLSWALIGRSRHIAPDFRITRFMCFAVLAISRALFTYVCRVLYVVGVSFVIYVVIHTLLNRKTTLV